MVESVHGPAGAALCANLLDAKLDAGRRRRCRHRAGAGLRVIPVGAPGALRLGTPTTFRAGWAAILGNGGAVAGNRFRISVDGTPYVEIDLASLNVAGISAASVAASQTALAALIKGAIDPALPLGKTVQVNFVAGPTPPVADGNATALLSISSTTSDVFIQPAATNDLAVPLMLGTAQGGLEVFALCRGAAGAQRNYLQGVECARGLCPTGAEQL